MKQRALAALTLLSFFLLLFFPEESFHGAGTGILLWFHQVLPSLLPFFILSGMLIGTGAANALSRLCSPFLCPLFQISSPACYAVLTGFLCGYPMGSRSIADLIQSGNISQSEGRYLLSFCNNTSPAFIISFLVLQNLQSRTMILPFLCLLTGSPILCSFLFRHFYEIDKKPSNLFPVKTSSKSIGLILENSINAGIESIVKIGVYIMLFSILTTVIQSIPAGHFNLLQKLLLPSLELTNGVVMICDVPCPQKLRYLLLLFLSSFGGWCCIAQTASMIQSSGLKIGPYIIQKLITALATSFFAFLYFYMIL